MYNCSLLCLEHQSAPHRDDCLDGCYFCGWVQASDTNVTRRVASTDVAAAAAAAYSHVGRAWGEGEGTDFDAILFMARFLFLMYEINIFRS